MKLGFLFGAGAEVGYGLPNGGRFALDIFRHDTFSSKSEFKEMRDSILKTTKYASSWLPDDYSTKNISSYGKAVFESIIKDTVEHNRDVIIKKLNDFDKFAKTEAKSIFRDTNKDVTSVIEKYLNKSIDDSNMNQIIAFIDAFKEGNGIFSNNYFSALLEIYKRQDILEPEVRTELGKIIIAILQLHIGALSEKLTRKINDNLFLKKDDDIDIFDDLGEIIQLNYQATGLTGMEYLLEKRRANTDTDSGLILRFAQCTIESIYASVLDYKSLIDSNWHYLYCPKYEWAKFCKISIFLLTVREYILEQSKKIDFSANKSYYDDLKSAIDNNLLNVSKIATTNYNKFISDIIGEDIVYLNGSTEKWYDPYLNKIDSREKLSENEKHFFVPLLFTQSGTKPMTSIDMSIEYVNTYYGWGESDAIVVIGFGFNPDDEHINGILRTLIDDDGKKLIVIALKGNDCESNAIKQISDKLKIKSRDKISLIQLDSNRKIDNRLWIDVIIEKIEADLHL